MRSSLLPTMPPPVSSFSVHSPSRILLPLSRLRLKLATFFLLSLSASPFHAATADSASHRVVVFVDDKISIETGTAWTPIVGLPPNVAAITGLKLQLEVKTREWILGL
ncbi:hypothetical protein AAHA92_00455 [Salvia divinorum]|uniref:Uncharacterized protein n=1 Tax=Salvia divinorum TaxID=28513 RepID=A0ABD1IK88_SALDI